MSDNIFPDMKMAVQLFALFAKIKRNIIKCIYYIVANIYSGRVHNAYRYPLNLKG